MINCHTGHYHFQKYSFSTIYKQKLKFSLYTTILCIYGLHYEFYDGHFQDCVKGCTTLCLKTNANFPRCPETMKECPFFDNDILICFQIETYYRKLIFDIVSWPIWLMTEVSQTRPPCHCNKCDSDLSNNHPVETVRPNGPKIR